MRASLLILVLTGLMACQGSVKDITVIRQASNPHFPPLDSISGLDGEQLSYIYCQQCHQYPEPQFLKSEQWEDGVLPRMGHRLGIWKSRSEAVQGLDMMEEYLVNQANIYPKEPMISEEAWNKLKNYYLSHASKNTTQLTFPQNSSRQFEAHQRRLNNDIPLLTMLDYDEKSGQLHIGLRNDQLWIEDEERTIKKITTTGPPISRIKQNNKYAHVLSMGIMDPSNQAKGMLYRAFGDSLQAIAGELRRPVHLLSHDINEDGEDDLLISEFGNDIGQLSAVLLKKGRPYKKQVLIPEPGARKTIAYDWNQDGKEDLLVLMAQGDERIVLLEKEEAGLYREKTLLRFPPVYGSSYFELADFNGDGLKDIVYVNGDNADYSYALKPYHGIRIFLNREEETPKEAYFFPFYGATEAVAWDFDQDGDMDIAGIAYFGNFEGNAASGAVYLENTTKEKGLTFQPMQIPEASSGRWLTMEVADTDHDGDEDLLLGSCVLVRTPVPDTLKTYWEQEGASILHLENKLK
ncbi:VCBS repeat-containing protein [Catalinimonas sp. 4WD22]|uniref:FG-GAP repeat domain-containing protein n=1 Tax=Catalinimonas locisalis TaxID=3133978 RepID=UPI003100FB7A